ncbi:MAG: hypothetical protein V7K25_13285 [Nostoc sp.]|uniref:hypothetical protein n=1 Tax=Nostoc sp. TaxID=1180 RepID=UPI002FFC2D2E
MSKAPAPLFLGNGALTLNRTPKKRGVVPFKRTFFRITGLNPALRVNRAPVSGVLGGFERQNWVVRIVLAAQN